MKNERIAWVDLLRIVACFLVVFSHCCDPFIAEFDNDRTTFLTGAFGGSLVRCCVPLFVMVSGVVLLPVKMDTISFYKKRIGRIALPLVFWSLALPLLFFVYFHFHGTTQNPMIDINDFTWAATLPKLYTFLFNFNFATIPLWYLYMLIGLYLAIPVVNAWLNQARQKEVKTVLWIWFATLFLPYLQVLAPLLGYKGNYGNMGLWGVCDWNAFGSLYYLSGFLGYLVLAHYLVKYPLGWSMKKTLWIAIPLFLVGYAITAFAYINTAELFPGNSVALEVIWYFAGINVFMMSVAVYIVMQKIKIASSPFLTEVSSLTFGIYLCHFVIVQLAYDFFRPFENMPTAAKIPLMALTAFCISYGVVWVLARFGLTRKLVM